MSRSKRYREICGISLAKSEKKDKKIASHKVRAIIRRYIKTDIEKIIDITNKDVSNIWSMPKDGKQYIGHIKKKNPMYYKKLMRK